jgi:hypothetical protein
MANESYNHFIINQLPEQEHGDTIQLLQGIWQPNEQNMQQIYPLWTNPFH